MQRYDIKYGKIETNKSQRDLANKVRRKVSLGKVAMRGKCEYVEKHTDFLSN